jgi:hypothetical protein
MREQFGSWNAYFKLQYLLQYLWFEYREVNGERVFGSANGAVWWQITVRQIGCSHVLIVIAVFQDGSWVKMNLSRESLHGVIV